MALACIYCLFTQINVTALGLPETSQTLLISFVLKLSYAWNFLLTSLKDWLLLLLLLL